MFVKLGPTGLPMLYYLGYKYWHKSAFSKAKKLHEKSRFEIVHQLTQISFREPGFGWKLNVPFIWGPTGGTSKIPKDIYNSLPLQFKIFEKIRSFSNIYRFKLVPRLIKANKKASIIYAFSNADANKLKKKALGNVKIMLDVGTSSHAEVSKNDLANNSMLRGVWCGRLSDYKAPAILLGALGLSQATKDKVQFQIIGSGSGNSLLKMADGLNLTNIEWIKEVKHSEIFAIMANADFFVHTSIREATSSVIPAKNVKILIEKEFWGLYNMVCGGETSRFEVAEEILKILSLENTIKITPVKSDYFKKIYFAERPASERLANYKLSLRGLNLMKDWKIALREYISQYYQDYLD